MKNVAQPKQTQKQPAKSAMAEQIWGKIPQVHHIQKEFPAQIVVVVVPDALEISHTFQSGEGTPQGSALSPFLIAMAMDRLTEEQSTGGEPGEVEVCPGQEGCVGQNKWMNRINERGGLERGSRAGGDGGGDAELLFGSKEDAEDQERVQPQGHVRCSGESLHMSGGGDMCTQLQDLKPPW